MQLRSIEKTDNAAVAALIRHSLEKEHLAIPGTAYYDPYLDDLAGYYQSVPRAAYFVLENCGQIVGAGGFAPISSTIAELQKLYVATKCQGQGLSSMLLRSIFEEAKKRDFAQIYLESSSQLAQAVKVYKHFGFIPLEKPLANDAGHTAMNVWMIKDL